MKRAKPGQDRRSRANAPGTPAHECALCPRLVSFRKKNRQSWPDWFNAPVPSFGPQEARLLIVGLAPGLRGANCSGRPFTGDYAGDVLYAALNKFGWSKGRYRARLDDGLILNDCRITNAVRCVPPENKPIGTEIKNCGEFLKKEIAAMPSLAVILALGKIAHDSVLAALAVKRSAHPFGHGRIHPLPGGRVLADSYHCSRYNMNTGRLTEKMFHEVFDNIRSLVHRGKPKPIKKGA